MAAASGARSEETKLPPGVGQSLARGAVARPQQIPEPQLLELDQPPQRFTPGAAEAVERLHRAPQRRTVAARRGLEQRQRLIAELERLRLAQRQCPRQRAA